MKATEVLNSMADALVDLAGAAYEQWAVALTGYREAIQERRQRQIADRSASVSKPAQQYMVDTSAFEKRTPDLISVGEPASAINPAFIIATNRQHGMCQVL